MQERPTYRLFGTAIGHFCSAVPADGTGLGRLVGVGKTNRVNWDSKTEPMKIRIQICEIMLCMFFGGGSWTNGPSKCAEKARPDLPTRVPPQSSPSAQGDSKDQIKGRSGANTEMLAADCGSSIGFVGVQQKQSHKTQYKPQVSGSLSSPPALQILVPLRTYCFGICFWSEHHP